MKTRLLLLATLLLVSTACDSANPVAPSGTVLFVTASPQQIPVNGSSTITVTGFRPDGNPINPGTQVRLTTTLGNVSPSVVVADSSGRGVATLQGDGRSGSATVEATLITSSSGGGGGGGGTDGTADGDGGGGGGGAGTASNTVTVTIGQTDESKPSLEVTVTPSTVDLGETATVRVLARSADGSRFGAGGVISLATSLGSISPTQVTTDAQGEATATFSAGNQTGTATISANLGSADTATADVVIENQRPELILSANPSTIPVNGESTITIIARDDNGVPLGAGEEILLTADLGSIRSRVSTNASGVATAVFTAGGLAGNGSVTAILRNSEPETVAITIRDAPAFIDLTANPTSVPSSGGTITLTARVRNAQGDGVGSAVVDFSSSIGGTFAPDDSVTTDNNGEAEVMLTVSDSQIGSRSSFTVTATVFSEGQELSDTVVIDIQ